MGGSANVFEGLRAQALSLTPAKLNLTPLPSGIFGALMEFAYQATVVSLVAIGDGSTSLYFSTGGGVIGAGASQTVRKANQMFLETAGKFVAQFPETTSFPTPGTGRARFYLLAADGVHASDEIEEQALQQRANPLFPLYAAGQNVITQIRIVESQRKR